MLPAPVHHRRAEHWQTILTTETNRRYESQDIMTLLPILYWIVLILSFIGYFAPATWPGGRYLSGGAATVLFIIIGLRIFRIPLQ